MRFQVLGLLFLVAAHSVQAAIPFKEMDCRERVRLEMVKQPGEDRWQAQNWHLYSYAVLPSLANDNPYRKLPKGIPAELALGFNVLFQMTRDPHLNFLLLQELEEEVVHSGQTLHQVLEKWEAFFGFEKAVVVTDFLSKADFCAHLRAGRPIADEYWRGKPHTRDGHRIQSIIEAKRIHGYFAGADRTYYLELYKFMGNLEVLRTLDWSGTGVDMSLVDPNDIESYPDLWAILHDTPFFSNAALNFQAHDFTNPEFFSAMRFLLPGLKGWE